MTTEASRNLEQALAAAQRARFDATISGNVPVLEQLIADDLIYLHSTGRVDTKSSFIHSLGERGLPYRAFDIEAQQVRILGDAGVVTAIIRLTQRGADGDHSHRSRCTSVWTRRGGRWQEVLWQATRLPE